MSVPAVFTGCVRSDARTGSIVSIATAALIYWLAAPFFVESWYWETKACLLFAVVGIFRPALSATLAALSINIMGPTLSSTLVAVTPLFGAMLAIALLGEQMTPPVAVGTAMVMAGAIIASWNTQNVKRNWPLWAIALPLGAALIRASAHAVTKVGLVEVPSPSFVVLVANSVSLVVAVTAFRLQGLTIVGTRQSFGWFVASGVAVALSLQCLNTALQTGDLISVIPIVSATPLFTLLMGFLWFGRETITARTLCTLALIVSGVVLIGAWGR